MGTGLSLFLYIHVEEEEQKRQRQEGWCYRKSWGYHCGNSRLSLHWEHLGQKLAGDSPEADRGWKDQATRVLGLSASSETTWVCHRMCVTWMHKLGTKGFTHLGWAFMYFHLLLPSLPPPDEKVTDVGALEADKEFVREDPLSLPDKFSWDDINLSDSAQVPAFICTNYRPLPLLYFSLCFLLLCHLLCCPLSLSFCHFYILLLLLLPFLYPLFSLPLLSHSWMSSMCYSVRTT